MDTCVRFLITQNRFYVLQQMTNKQSFITMVEQTEGRDSSEWIYGELSYNHCYLENIKYNTIDMSLVNINLHNLKALCRSTGYSSIRIYERAYGTDKFILEVHA